MKIQRKLTYVAIGKIPENNIIIISQFNINFITSSAKNKSMLKFYPFFFQSLKKLTKHDSISQVFRSCFDQNQKVSFRTRRAGETDVPGPVFQPKIGKLVNPFVAFMNFFFYIFIFVSSRLWCWL